MKSGFAKGAVFAAGLLATAAPALAATGILYSFTNQADGGLPYAGVLERDGMRYGTTRDGGAHGLGTIYVLAPDGVLTVLHDFDRLHGAHPFFGALVADAQGNLYGTTYDGGTGDKGTVYKLAPDGAFTVLHSFQSTSRLDGATPYSGLLLDGQGNLYGTAAHGGSIRCGLYGCGLVFKIAPDGSYSTLHSFDYDDGAYAQSLIADGQGNFYGTTFMNVFKLAPDGGFSVLHSFTGAAGNTVNTGLSLDASGNLYGTTAYGGAHGVGMLFKIAPDGTTTVLHEFDGATGYLMVGAPLPAADGKLYGATMKGGQTHYPHCSDMSGCGTVFRLAPTGRYTVLQYFDGLNGYWPVAGLTTDRHGNLIGTTSRGGPGGYGTVFKLKRR